MKTEFKVNGKDLLGKVEELIKEGNIRRIIIKDGNGKTFIEIPLSIGVIGVLAAPIMAAVGALAGLVANFTIEVIKKDDSTAADEAEFTEVKAPEEN